MNEKIAILKQLIELAMSKGFFQNLKTLDTVRAAVNDLEIELDRNEKTIAALKERLFDKEKPKDLPA
jgi:hypothetical protein